VLGLLEVLAVVEVARERKGARRGNSRPEAVASGVESWGGAV
jgi:hypothetical protein